jgi:hypothetical protein
MNPSTVSAGNVRDHQEYALLPRAKASPTRFPLDPHGSPSRSEGRVCRVLQTLRRPQNITCLYRGKHLARPNTHTPAINPRMHDRAASRPVLNLNALALLILNATVLSLTCELPKLYLGRQMAYISRLRAAGRGRYFGRRAECPMTRAI